MHVLIAVYGTPEAIRNFRIQELNKGFPSRELKILDFYFPRERKEEFIKTLSPSLL